MDKEITNAVRDVSGATGGLMVGGIFLLVGGILSAVFVPMIDFDSLKFTPDKIEITEGTVIESKDAGVEVNDETYYETNFSYEFKKVDYTAKSYGPYQFDEGDQIEVQVLRDTPEIARIGDYQSKPFPIWVMFVLIFPAIGLIAFISGLFSLARAIQGGRGMMTGVMSAIQNSSKISDLQKKLIEKRGFRLAGGAGMQGPASQPGFGETGIPKVAENGFEKGRMTVLMLCVVGFIGYLVWIFLIKPNF